MKNILGIRRENLDKKGEQRVAIDPDLAERITTAGFTLLVQPAIHPVSSEAKRAFKDQSYQQAGCDVSEDLTSADIIFGLKEVNIEDLLPGKAYLFFSHTHKGQLKNRNLLKAMIDRKITLIDYELIQNPPGQRVITAFTYMAGYAGMIDSLWTLGKKWNLQGMTSPIEKIPQSIVKGDLESMKALIKEVGYEISQNGTPERLPPIITAFLGNGRTSQGAQEIYDLLPSKEVQLEELPEVFSHGDRKYVYKWVADIPELYRIKPNSHLASKELSRDQFFHQYFTYPGEFESNMDLVFPYATMWMNCILWAPNFPRLITRQQAKSWYEQSKTLQVIGDITCDPEGAIEFSQETWIDDPVFTYYPDNKTTQTGFERKGISVMAITNLPCEFSADSSHRFSHDIREYMDEIIHMNTKANTPEQAGLSGPIAGATILWKGQFTPTYQYMEEYLQA